MANVFNVGDSVLCTVEKDGAAVAKRGTVLTADDASLSVFFIEIGKQYTLKAYDDVADHCGINKTSWNNIRKKPVTVDSVRDGRVYLVDHHGMRWFVRIDSLVDYVPAPTYNGKVVCVDNDGQSHRYTVGKIYTFVDGYMTNNHDVQPKSRPIKDFADWQDFSDCDWVEIVED